ncbi:4a-hydroxytetrahydrobiopterin dehydratase [Klenkia taihuensis]|uniref:Putative pterin-4-alpha-carbinolamine dehydratase n=1 Tax=Klenkia taihuensis TaxID=1225127 RepID=A0A1I1MKU0_9ACTN|nr:4a-hydroxytetrahydrobiopterin dehydratase [Klenkia taihuensis]GHE14235.1 putative pterin-4-alpha-carbinolamine dehydratase [Klenkia taihuensis]SFC83818.1 4a-hydroxytetrahydrobiopterin dehydratase [Klenkia taihuensis]
MSRPQALPAEEVAAAVAELTHWDGDAQGIYRRIEAGSFRAAIDLVDRIADVAEEMDHHPDIDIRYSCLRIAVVTHDAGGVTELDVELARRVDALSDGAAPA